MKISEAMDYVIAVAPRRAFPTHEMLLSRGGQDPRRTRDSAGRPSRAAASTSPLEPGDTIDF